MPVFRQVADFGLLFISLNKNKKNENQEKV